MNLTPYPEPFSHVNTFGTQKLTQLREKVPGQNWRNEIGARL